MPNRIKGCFNYAFEVSKLDNQENTPKINSLIKQLPEVVKCFDQLHDAIITDGALPVKTKELIAVGIAVAVRCSPCIHRHVAFALKAGNTPAEISEAISVGILLGGGPAFIYAQEAAQVLDSLIKDKKEQ